MKKIISILLLTIIAIVTLSSCKQGDYKEDSDNSVRLESSTESALQSNQSISKPSIKGISSYGTAFNNGLDFYEYDKFLYIVNSNEIRTLENGVLKNNATVQHTTLDNLKAVFANGYVYTNERDDNNNIYRKNIALGEKELEKWRKGFLIDLLDGWIYYYIGDNFYKINPTTEENVKIFENLSVSVKKGNIFAPKWYIQICKDGMF
jgi:hypothetical protein